MSMENRDRRARIGFGVANVAVAAFVAFGVFRLLPTRWWVVDAGAIAVSLLLGSSGLTLLARAPIADRLTRVASAVALVLGLAVFAAIALTASWISGVYSQVGITGAIVFGLVAALVLPYLVVLPAVELAWIGPRERAEPRPDADGQRADGDAPEIVEPTAPTEPDAKTARRDAARREKKRRAKARAGR